jgi:hypothetical protein
LIVFPGFNRVESLGTAPPLAAGISSARIRRFIGNGRVGELGIVVGKTAAPPDGKNSQDSYYLPVDLEFFVPVLATCCTQVIIVVVYSSVI